jgi:integrase
MNMEGITRRGNSFQVKYKPPSGKRISATFKTAEEAVAFRLRCKAAATLGKELPAAEAVAGNAATWTIQKLFERVDRKRWRGSAKWKCGDGGSVGNAKRFVEWCGPNMPAAEALAEDKIAEFIEHRADEHENSGTTLNKYTWAISALCSEAVKLEIIHHKPDLPKHPDGQCRIRIFSPEEELMIDRTARLWGYEDHADWFRFLCDTGCRPGETQKLEWRDIIGNKIHLERGITKNSTERTITATPRVLEVLARMKAKYGDKPGPFAWASVKRHAARGLWDRLRGQLDFMDDETVMYTYRHTCASRLVQRGIDLYRVQIWMGHKTPKMTQRYAKFSPRHLEELAQVLAA